MMSIWRTEDKIFKRAHLIMAVLFVLLSGYILAMNREQQGIIIASCMFYLALTLFRHFYLTAEQKAWQTIFPFLEGGAIYSLALIDPLGLPLIILIMWDIALDYRYSYGIFFAVIGYIAYMTVFIPHNAIGLPVANIILLIGITIIQFVLFVGFAFLAKSYSIQSQKLQKTTAELNARMIAMEEMTVLKERNRIALEIHNTVGHQLTTALVQIEAAQMLLDKDLDESKRRLGIIKDQVRDGLQEIRQAVYAMRAEHEYEDFAGAVRELLIRVDTHAKVQVDCTMNDITTAKLEAKKALYHVMLESITNAIKHGHCQKMIINLTQKQGIITLSSYNDGQIPTNLHFGYGLKTMKENLAELGGSLQFCLGKNGWFGLIAELPVYKQEGDGDGQDQHYAGR